MNPELSHAPRPVHRSRVLLFLVAVLILIFLGILLSAPSVSETPSESTTEQP